MHHPIIHILLALQLALWTPVMCCCAIKGAIGTVTGVAGAMCDAERCCAARENRKISCCEAEAVCGETDLAGDAQHSGDGGCRCHERITDRIQIDTGGKISIPIPTAGMAWHLTTSIDASTTPRIASPGRSAVAWRAHPPPKTLLSQHCLLLI